MLCCRHRLWRPQRPQPSSSSLPPGCARVLEALDFCQAPQKLQPAATALPLSVSADVWCLCSLPPSAFPRPHLGCVLHVIRWRLPRELTRLPSAVVGVRVCGRVSQKLCSAFWNFVLLCWRVAKSHRQHYPHWHHQHLAPFLFALVGLD